MSSDKHCCVPGCKESGEMQPVLHSFPNPEKERIRFNNWLYKIGGDILSLQNEHIYKFRRVCRAHFELKHLCRNNRLSNIAVPNLNIPDPLSSKRLFIRKPMQDIYNLPKPSTSSDPTYLNMQMPTSEMTLGTVNYTNKENVYPQILIDKTKKHSSNTSRCFIEIQENEDSVPEKIRNKTKILSRKVFFSKPEEEIYKKIINARIRLSKMKNKLKKQMAQVKISKRIVSNCSSNVLANSTSLAKLLFKLQGRENNKKEQGRRFTLEEKIASLSIFKHSPKAYKFLRSIFILPAAQTLIKLIHQSKLTPGFNKNIFFQLKKKSESIKNTEKLCVLLFDEVSLKVNVTYQERKDEVAGFIDNGREKTAEYADHALVFMIRGLLHNYKQPIYYSFSKNCTKGPELANQIKEVVKGIQEAGFIVLATVCDQGTNNRQALKWLLNETRGIYLRRKEQPKENIILINNREVIYIVDCTHIKIVSPGGNRAELYRNRKGYFSVNVQAICDANLKIQSIIARWPGSVHDTTIWNDSPLAAQFETGRFGSFLILGDSGYPCLRYLMTPILNPTTPPQEAYNRAHITTRNTIERCFGVLKRRFPCLQSGMQLKLPKVLKVIVACVALHNMTLHLEDYIVQDELAQEDHYDETVPQAHTQHFAARTAIVENYFST